ncbi:MAG TPA: type II toxin-antitoxin system RelE/ParE family toxin [Candidatus Nanoarchaeia archaeon]|nr:type II toxin-antitoxin system RelE/ParE family toxin [Candidatus Nanoarchaeia archaeon]
MVYSVEFSQNAKKELDKLEKDIAIRILRKLREIKEEPHGHIKRLVGSDLFSLRVGDYRILIAIVENKLFVTKIGHRKDVYE